MDIRLLQVFPGRQQIFLGCLHRCLPGLTFLAAGRQLLLQCHLLGLQISYFPAAVKIAGLLVSPAAAGKGTAGIK